MREITINKYISAINCAYSMLGYTNEFFADVNTLTKLKYIDNITLKKTIGEYKNLSSVNCHDMVPKLRKFCEEVKGEHIIHSYKKDFKVYFEVLKRE